jgi:hypothetical protein
MKNNATFFTDPSTYLSDTLFLTLKSPGNNYPKRPERFNYSDICYFKKTWPLNG